MSEYKLKKLRLRNPDGSLSEMYDIGADAANIDVENKMTLDVKLNNMDVKINANKEAAGAASKMAGENKTSIDNMSEQVAAAQKDIIDLDAIVKTKPYIFDTIADMKKANLKVGDTCQTLGFYEINDGGGAYYFITDKQDGSKIQVNFGNGLLYAELITKNNKINILQLGAKNNGEDIDNTIYFVKAIEWANTNGGTIYLQKGVYICKTPININKPLNDVKIIGDGFKSNDNKGTLIKWEGEGYFLTLSKGGFYYKLDNFEITGNKSNDGIYCKGTRQTLNFKAYINNIKIGNVLKGLEVEETTYFFINNYTFGGADAIFGLKLKGFEFTYINNCSIDGFNNNVVGSSGIIITSGVNTYLNNTDICNWFKGIGLNIRLESGNINQNFFSNVNIIRCQTLIETNAYNQYITQLSFDKCSLNPGSTTEHIINCIRQVPYTTQQVSFNNLILRKIEQTNVTKLLDGGFISDLKLDIMSNIGNLPLDCMIGQYTNYYFNCNTLANSKLIILQNDKTDYLIQMKYPKLSDKINMNIQVMNVSTPYKIGDITYNSDNKSYDCHLVFDTTPANSFKIIATIIPENILH